MKKTNKRDLSKRPIKETKKRDLQQRPINSRDRDKRPVMRPIKET